jgi:hypothetical protein
MRTLYLMVVVACLAAAAPAQAQAQPRTTDSPALGAQVRRDLEAIFEPDATLDQNVSPYRQTAARARLRTRPYATSIAGICRRDELIVDYGGPRPFADNPAANAVAPYGVSAEGWYRVLRDIPSASYEGRAREGECTMLSGAESRGWFVAPNVYVAADGYRAFAAAIGQLNAPGRGLAGCRENRQSQANCRRVLQAPERIVRIDRCFAPARRFCYALALGGDDSGTTVTLRLHYNGRSGPRIDAVEIEWPEISV